MKIFRMLLILFPLLAFSTPSIAQNQCAPRESVVGLLELRVQEKLNNVGIVNQKQVIEIFVNKRTKTWTILGSSLTAEGEKRSCILFYGTTWMSFEEPIGDPVKF